MNIGIFTDTYYPQINGVVTSVAMLEKELVKRGNTVYIFTTTDPNANEKSETVLRVPSMPYVFSPSQRMALVYPPQLLLKLKGLKLDIVHTQTEFPLGIFGKVVSEFFKIPQVHTYHTMYEDYVHYVANGHLVTPKMAQQYSRIFCNRARAIIAPTEKTRASLLDYDVVRPIRVIPTGIDFEPFSREKYSKDDINKLKQELGLNVTDPIVVSVGRIAKEKSIDAVLRQFPALLLKMPAAKFVIVGDGPLKEMMVKLTKELGIEKSVLFAGKRPWSEIGKYYQLGDVFISASTSETQGLTYMEAMAAKVPVIAKKDDSVEGLIIDGKTGYYFERDEQIADVIYNALSNEQQRADIAETAFESIFHLSSVKFAEDVESLYHELLRAYPKRTNKRRLTVVKTNRAIKTH